MDPFGHRNAPASMSRGRARRRLAARGYGDRGEEGGGPGGQGAHQRAHAMNGEAREGRSATQWCPACRGRGGGDRDGGVDPGHPRLDSLAGNEEDGEAHLVVASALHGVVGGEGKLDGGAVVLYRIRPAWTGRQRARGREPPGSIPPAWRESSSRQSSWRGRLALGRPDSTGRCGGRRTGRSSL